jgi:hypothetical protein
MNNKTTHKMKKPIKQLLVAIFIIFVGTAACKKDSYSSGSTTVEYKINPMNVYFTKISYTDNNGNSVEITDPSQFTGGVKSITLTKKPFLAKIETKINNTTSATIPYTLTISVDGQVKTIAQAGAPAMASSSDQASYNVQ